MLLQDYLSDWLTLKSAGLKPRTIEFYSYAIRHISVHLGETDVNALTNFDVGHALAAICAQHSRTAEMCYVLLRNAIADFPNNPMKGVTRPMYVQTSPKPWSDDQIAIYVQSLHGHPHQIPLLLAVSLGMRRGEICGLRWSDIDFDSSTIHICNQRQRMADGSIVDCPPKSITSDRVIPVPVQLMKLLRDHRQIGGYVCHLTPSGLNSAHRRLVRDLGLPPIPLHGLRHSFATACVRHGGSMKALQLLLGHSSYAITANKYTQPDMQMLREAMDMTHIM